MRLRAGALSAGVAVGLLVPLLCGCGGSSGNGVAKKSAAGILAAGRAAAAGASSVRVVSRATVGTNRLALQASLGKDVGRARIVLSDSSYETILEEGTLYLRGNKVFSSGLSHSQGIKIPAGTWVKAPAKGAFAQLASTTSIAKELPVMLGGTGALKKGSTSKVDGQPAIEVSQARKLATATLFIATSGRPYPLLLRKRGRETGQTRFSGWNQPVRVKVPAGAVAVGGLGG